MSFEDKVELGDKCLERILTSDKTPGFTQTQITMAGIANVTGHYLVSRIDAKVHILLFSIDGSGLLETSRGSVEIPSHSIAIIPTGHSFQFSLASEKWSLAWLLLAPSEKWDLSDRNPSVIEDSPLANSVYHLMNVIYYSTENQEKALTGVNFVSPLSDILTQILHSPDTQSRLKQVQSVFSRVQERLHAPWQVEDMAEIACVSPSHFHRLCKQAIGKSPNQRLIELRMERAKHYLKSSSWLVSDIAIRVGYADAYNFSHAFKKFQGVSPKQFREET